VPVRVEPTTEANPPRAQVGSSFEGFFRDVYPRLARGLLLLTADRSEAEDLAQEAMARVFERWDRVRGMNSREGYVYRTALNMHRKRVRWSALRRKWRRDPEPEHRPLDAVEDREEIRRLLAALPAPQREALFLVKWVGMTAEQAGRALGIDAVSVRGRIHRARQALRQTRKDDDG
jgi:RNA polymerase sigma factor (sigma-70 family)